MLWKDFFISRKGIIVEHKVECMKFQGLGAVFRKNVSTQ